MSEDFEPTAADALASKLRIHKMQGQIFALQTMLLCLLAALKAKSVIRGDDIELLISTSETTIADAYERTKQKIDPAGIDYIDEAKAASDAMLQSLRLQLSEAENS